MNTTNQGTVDKTKPETLISFSRSIKNKLAMGFAAVALLAVGSLFAINYPLETMIVTLFIGSVFVLDRR
jgi:branched-subunit amino acid permease